MGVFHHDPFIPWIAERQMAFEGNLGGFPLGDVSQVNHVPQHFRNGGAGPFLPLGVGVYIQSIVGHAAVYRRRRNAALVKASCNFRGRRPFCCHSKDALDHLAGLPIHYKMIFVHRIFLVAVRRKGRNVSAIPHLGGKSRADLLGCIPRIHLIDDVFEGGNVRIRAVGIVAVMDGDVAYALGGEIDLRILPCRNVVASQAGKVFGDDHIDLLCFDVPDHPLEIRAVKVCAAPAVVYIFVKYNIAVFRRIAPKHFALRDNACAFRGAGIVFG